MKFVITIILFSLSCQLMGQRQEEMLTKSLLSYLNYQSVLRTRVYICNDGLPVDFPTNSISNAIFFSLKNFNGLPKPLKKELKKGISASFISTKLMDNQFTVTIGGRNVKLIKKNHIEISVASWGIFIYEYSCEKQKWLLIKTEYGGI